MRARLVVGMIRWPWSSGDDDADAPEPPAGFDDEPTITCEFQDGTLFVYDDIVFIRRAGPSKFEDKAIPRGEITEVTYSKGSISHLQIEQAGFENDDGGFMASPVDENTLHFGRGGRDCAQQAREELLFGSQPP